MQRCLVFPYLHTTPADVCGVADLTETPEGAHGIDALTTGAEIWHNLHSSISVHRENPQGKNKQKSIQMQEQNWLETKRN